MLWSVMCDSGMDRQKLICYGQWCVTQAWIDRSWYVMVRVNVNGQRETLNSMVRNTCKMSCWIYKWNQNVDEHKSISMMWLVSLIQSFQRLDKEKSAFLTFKKYPTPISPTLFPGLPPIFFLNLTSQYGSIVCLFVWWCLMPLSTIF